MSEPKLLDIMQIIVDTYPTWQKVDLTKKGYIAQRELKVAIALMDLAELLKQSK